MHTHATKIPETHSRTAAADLQKKPDGQEPATGFTDHRPEIAAQLKLQETITNSQRTGQLRAYQELADNRGLQQQPIQKKANGTGLPDTLKSGIEQLSGYSMNDVKVHYHSEKPGQLQAHAYAQGSDIHLAPGQEKHLPHEAWHVVQQKQGRVKPTLQMADNVTVNDETGLEQEADRMGAKAVQLKNDPSFTEPKALPQAAGASSQVVQRFTILNPTHYQTSGKNQAEMFPANQLIRGKTKTTDHNSVESITEKLNWERRYALNPPLKVSQNGILALQSTVGQPKVFYGEPGEVDSFRQRLINIQSRITLKEESGHTVTVPKTPKNPGGDTHKLSMVKPVLSPHMKQDEELMNVNVCTNVSEAIVGGKILSIGNPEEGEKLSEDKITIATAGGLGKTVNTLTQDSTPGDFITEQKKNRNTSRVYRYDLVKSQEVDAYFANGLLKKSHLIPTDQILKALSLDGVPKSVWEQVYNLHVGKQESQRPNEDLILGYINEYLQIKETLNYNLKKRDKQLVSRLGINETANPEVGESFSTFAQTSPKVVDEDRVLSHELDTSTLNVGEMREVLKRFKELKKSVGELGQFAGKHYKKAKNIIPFAEHHAAVVAKDGPDTITFENYNRQVESDTLQERIWDSWFTKMDEFNGSITGELRQMLKNVREEREKNQPSPITKYMKVLAEKRENLQRFQQDFVQLTAKTRAKLDTNILAIQNDLWHFNMYGPANETFINEEQEVKPQSFHETWSGSIANAITVRTTALVNDELSKAVQKKAEIIAYQLIKAGNFEDKPDIYQGVKAEILKNLHPSKKRIEISDVLVRLEKTESKYQDLDPEEQQEAALLFTDNKLGILRKILEFRQGSNRESQSSEFNRNMALKILPTSYTLGLKYVNWHIGNKNESKRLTQKANFFTEFYKGIQ